jgi:uncharacterized protein (DUF433 family)
VSVQGLEEFSKNQLIEELINRQTFVGLVIFHRGDAKAGRLEPGEIVITKSPPLTREGVEQLLQIGQSLVPGMFVAEAATAADGLTLHASTPPLRVEEGGVVRVGNSRISLDVIVEHYENGMTPEELVRAYDTLVLSDVYAAIAYYLGHRNEVRAYLHWREDEARGLRSKLEADKPQLSRQELLERSPPRRAEETVDAPIGE